MPNKRQKKGDEAAEGGATGAEPGASFLPDVKVYLIHPATELHIKKYTDQPRVMVQETPDLYSTVTLPYISSIPEKRTAWVQNILDGLKEQESVVFADPDPANGFVVVPDSKWDRLRMEELYLQVLCRNPAIRSLRDLRAEHLPLLNNIRRTIGKRVEELYEGVKKEHLRMYIHYQPSYCELSSCRGDLARLYLSRLTPIAHSTSLRRSLPCAHHARKGRRGLGLCCCPSSFARRRDREPPDRFRILRQENAPLHPRH